MPVQLSEGSLAVILNGGEVSEPVLQVLGNKKISGTGSSERYRLLISDGININSFAMLATQLNEKVTSGELSDHTIIKIIRYITSNVSSATSNRRVLIILELSVIMRGTEVGRKIGDPIPITACETSPSSSSNSHTAHKADATNSTAGRANVSPQRNNRTSLLGTETSYGYQPPEKRVSTSFDPAANEEIKYTHKIATLNPYQNRWIIKARVTSKSQIRTWAKPTSEGKLFSMELLDDSGTIRATAFNDHVDKFYDMIEMNKVYFMSRMQLKPANKKFTSVPHDYEMTFTNETQIVPCLEDNGDLPQINYNFRPLSSLQNIEPDTVIDVIGVCKQASDLTSLIARTSQREVKKRDLTIVDNSMASVRVTLWGNDAEEFDGSTQPILVVKGARVTEFNGSKCLSVPGGAVISVNPDITEAHRLRGWFDSLNTSEMQFSNVSYGAQSDNKNKEVILLVEAKTLNMGMDDKPSFFNVDAVVMFINTEKAVYQACPSGECQKKVLDQNNGMYRCEKCCKEFPEFKYRLMLQAQICDYSGSQWVTIFQEAAETMLKGTAEEIGNSQEDFEKYDSFFRNALFKQYNFRLRAKMETFNNETRLRVSVVTVKDVDFKERSRNMLDEMKMLNA